MFNSKLWLFFLLSPLLFSDNNTSKSYNAFVELGNIFEPLFNTHANNITTIITVFSILFGGYITFIAVVTALKMQTIQASIHQNKEEIYTLKTNINENVHKISIDTKEEIDKLEKWIFTQMAEINHQREKTINKLENEIQNKVKGEIVSSASKLLKEVQNNAYEQLSYKMDTMRDNVEKRLFNYQTLIAKINILKKREYDKVLHSKIKTEDKLQSMVNIQHKYNETNNITIPKLLSNNVERDVIPSLRKLSKDTELREIIIDFFKNALDLKIFDTADTFNIKFNLQKYYEYNYDDNCLEIKK